MRSSDLGKGRFRNPVLFADYSDPDVIRVGDTFYMTASSFNYTPGLPILISKDLVNWRLVNYALENIGQERFKIPRHSEGVWAPSIRYHEGMFYIYYGMPDEGYYVVRTKDPLGKWEEPVCILEGKGLIDPCPFWDEDGRAYVIHGYAKSRIGFKSILGIFEMSPDGLSAISEDKFIFDGNDPSHPAVTIEGPKVYKRNGIYYILAPAGGVREGYQVALRSRDIRGPYEIKTVMTRGETVINGPHQGGLVDTGKGDEWFLHFQDRGLYGRICHLQPVSWSEDWPVIGTDPDDSGCGHPAYELDKPCDGEKEALTASDDFKGGTYGLCWQWLGDHCPDFFGQIQGNGNEPSDGLRLYALNPSGDSNPIIWRSANVLTQKLIYPCFRAEIPMDASGLKAGDRAGVVMTGGQYLAAFIELDENDAYHIKAVKSRGQDGDKTEDTVLDASFAGYLRDNSLSLEEGLKSIKWVMTFGEPKEGEDLYFRNVSDGEPPRLKIYLSFEGIEKPVKGGSAAGGYEPEMIDLGVDYTPSDHTWVGAKIGIFALATDKASGGYADFISVTVDEL
jgi:beta-xylosidase